MPRNAPIASGHRADSDSARERILAAAHQLFYQSGIRSTGVDRIITEAKVAKKSFYKHFPAKSDLVCTFLEERHEAWMGWFAVRVEAAGHSPKQQVFGVFDALEDWFREPAFRGCAFLNTIAESSAGDERHREIAAWHKEELRRYLERLLRRAGVAQPKARSFELLIAVDGAIVVAQTRRDPGAARQARELVRGMIGP